MNPAPVLAVSQHFAHLEDPRVERTRLHQLLDRVLMAICAVIAGAASWDASALFGETKHAWFERFLALPSADCRARPLHPGLCGLRPRPISRRVCFVGPGGAAERAAAGDGPGWQAGVRIAGPLSGESRHPSGQRLGQREPPGVSPTQGRGPVP